MSDFARWCYLYLIWIFSGSKIGALATQLSTLDLKKNGQNSLNKCDHCKIGQHCIIWGGTIDQLPVETNQGYKNITNCHFCFVRLFSKPNSNRLFFPLHLAHGSYPTPLSKSMIIFVKYMGHSFLTNNYYQNLQESTITNISTIQSKPATLGEITP